MEIAEEKWICCQIGARERYAVARALHQRDALDLLLTDAWVRPHGVLGLLDPGLRARFHPDLAGANVYAPGGANIAFELRSKLSGLHNWARTIARNDWFQKAAVARLSRIGAASASKIVMAYSYAALEIFRFARARRWRTVLGQIDAGIPEERIVERLYERDSNQRGCWQPAPPEYWSRWREECMVADRIVVNSVWSQEALVNEGFPAAKIKIIPVAYGEPKPNDGFRRQYPVKFTFSRPLRVLFLGQINLRKGIGPLLSAVRALRGKPIEFVFVGPVQISIPPDLRDDRQVRWVGSVPRSRVAEFYREADVFAFPTFSDGFGLTQLEAQAWKLPIVTTKFCGDVVKDGWNGWILPDITASSIGAMLRRCLAAPSHLQELSARCTVSGQFDLAHVGEQWIHVFD
jgi:glycosyltransferase involved in cell wall biosynthesis